MSQATVTIKFARLGQPAVEVLVEKSSTLEEALDAAGIDVNSDVRDSKGSAVALDKKMLRNGEYVVALGTKVQNG